MMISVCIPVYNTEKVLERCLESLAKQDFDSFEIVLVNDCSPGKNEKNWSCSKIIKKFKKTTKIPVNYLENAHNLGTLEVRRTLTYEAKGEFIFFLDSDDIIPPNALSVLYKEAVKTDADIIHGTLISGSYEDGKITKGEKQRLNKTYIGQLSDHDIFTKTFIEKQDAMILCSKLIKTKLLIDAFESIPFTYCITAEDYLILFFASLNAHSYSGIEDEVYYYINTEGLTSTKKITDLESCVKLSTASSVFTIIKTWIDENPSALSPKEVDEIREDAITHLYSNYTHLEALCDPSIKDEAMKILNEFWGESFVNLIKNSLNHSKKE
jgi:glycosyltransferase involved in cell wall biosynthesis